MPYSDPRTRAKLFGNTAGSAVAGMPVQPLFIPPYRSISDLKPPAMLSPCSKIKLKPFSKTMKPGRWKRPVLSVIWPESV